MKQLTELTNMNLLETIAELQIIIDDLKSDAKIDGESIIHLIEANVKLDEEIRNLKKS